MSTVDVDSLIPDAAKQDLKEVVALLGLARDTVIEIVKESRGARLDFGTSGSTLAGATKQAEDYKKKMDDLGLAMQQYARMLDQVTITQAKYDAMGSDSGKQLVDNRDKIRLQTQELRAQGDAYKLLVLQYTAAANEAKRLGAELGTTNQQYIAAAAGARQLGQQLLVLEQSVGQNFRQVGNYNVAGHELSQLLRELPAFTYSFNTGLLSMTNNFPMFLDAIKKLRDEGKTMPEIFKALGTSLISPINVITIAIDLFTIFSARMAQSGNAAKETKKDIDNLSEAYDRLIEKERTQQNIKTGGLSGSATSYVSVSSDQARELQRNIDLLKAQQSAAKGTSELAGITLKLKDAESQLAEVKKKDIDLQNQQNNAILNYAKAQLSRSNTRSIDQLNAGSALNSLFGVNTANVAKEVQDAIKSGQKLIDFQNAFTIEKENIRQRSLDQDNKSAIDRINADKNGTNKPVDLTNTEINTQERINKAKAALEKQFLEDDVTNQQAIFQNEENSLQQRLGALTSYFESKRALNNIDKNTELKDIQINLDKIAEIQARGANSPQEKRLVAQKEAFEAEKAAVVAKYTSKETQITVEALKEQQVITKQVNDATVQYYLDAQDKILVNNLVQYSVDQQQLINSLQHKQITWQTYQEKVKQLQDKYTQQGLDNIITYLQDILDNDRLTADERRKIQEALDKARVQSAKNANKQIEDDAKEKVQNQAKLQATLQQAGDQAISTISSVTKSYYDKQIKQQDDLIQGLEAQKQKQIDLVNTEVSTQDEKTRKIAQINLEYQRQEDVLTARKHDLQVKEAKFEKAASIASIIAKTAEAVLAALKIPVYGEALAIANGAIGALQLAKVIATPIPTYAKGTPPEGHPGGLALFGEAGPEIVRGHGPDYIVNKPTLAPLPKGTDVIPLRDIANSYMLPALHQKQDANHVMQSFDKHTEQVLEGLKKVATTIERQPVPNLKIIGNQWGNYLNNKL